MKKTNKIKRVAIGHQPLYFVLTKLSRFMFFVLAGEAKGERSPMAAPLLGLLPVNPETPGRILKKRNTKTL
jgi:hypothetical protein